MGWRPTDMHGNDHLGTGRNCGLDFVGVNLRSLAICVYKNRNGVLKQDHIDCGHEGIGRHDDLIAGTDTERVERSVQGSRSTGGGYTTLSSERAGPGPLEAIGKAAVEAAPPSLMQNVGPGLLVIGSNFRPGGKGLCSNRL